MFALLFLSLTLNVVSSVGVIFINKRLVFKAADYPFGTALTIIHFVVTFLGCVLFAKLKYFEPKWLDWRKVVSISIAFCGYVVFNNLSLLTNSVTMYQISKILCTPVIVGVERFSQGKRHSPGTLASLFPVCLGIIFTVWADNEINFWGCFWALLAVVANSFYTLWGKSKQQELGVTPMQILTYQAPMSALMLFICIPFFDDWHKLTAYKYTSQSLTYIGLSCIFAFGVNFSFFLFVGQTSALTMNVVGYFKTCLVFLGGFLFFETPLSVMNVFGISTTLVGLAMYSKAQLPPAVAPPSLTSVSSSGATGGSHDNSGKESAV